MVENMSKILFSPLFSLHFSLHFSHHLSSSLHLSFSLFLPSLLYTYLLIPRLFLQLFYNTTSIIYFLYLFASQFIHYLPSSQHTVIIAEMQSFVVCTYLLFPPLLCLTTNFTEIQLIFEFIISFSLIHSTHEYIHYNFLCMSIFFIKLTHMWIKSCI